MMMTMMLRIFHKFFHFFFGGDSWARLKRHKKDHQRCQNKSAKGNKQLCVDFKYEPWKKTSPKKNCSWFLVGKFTEPFFFVWRHFFWWKKLNKRIWTVRLETREWFDSGLLVKPMLGNRVKISLRISKPSSALQHWQTIDWWLPFQSWQFGKKY